MDHVVLQQGPSSLMESQVLLREDAARFAGEARANGTAVVLYGVWPERARLRALDAVTTSYARAAADAKGTLVAAGEGWRAAWARDPALALYGPDDFHPSPLGSYVAALMLFERLTGHTPIGLPNPATSASPALKRVRVDPVQLRLVQESAAQAGSSSRSVSEVLSSATRCSFHTAASVCVPWPAVLSLSGSTMARPFAHALDLALEDLQLGRIDDVVGRVDRHERRA